MQLTYVLKLPKPTKRKQNIFLNNIAEVVRHRQAVVSIGTCSPTTSLTTYQPLTQ